VDRARRHHPSGPYRRHRRGGRLQRLAWWDWDHDRLRAALPDFRQLSIEAFLEKYEPMSVEKPKRYPSQAPRSKTRQSRYRPEQTARS